MAPRVLRALREVGLLDAPVGGGLHACADCGPAGVAGATRSASSGRAAWCARGRRPAREPSAQRASLGASARCPARPRRRPRVPQPGSASASQASCPAFAHIIAELPNFACNSPETLSNHEFTTLELQRLQTLLKLLLIELHAKFGRRLCRFRPRALQPGPAIARGHRSQALRTGGVWCAVIASPDAASHSVQSSPCMACWRRQRYKVRPARLVGGDSGTKFAMLGQNPPNCAFLGEQGEFCTARAVRRGEQGEFCTGSGAVRLVQGEFCLAVAPSSFPVVGLASPVGTAASHRAP